MCSDLSFSKGTVTVAFPNCALTWTFPSQVNRSPSSELPLRYVGERRDTDTVTFERVTLDPYSLVGVTAAYDLTTRVGLFGRVENVTDEEYEEVFGFGTPGRAFYAGGRVTF